MEVLGDYMVRTTGNPESRRKYSLLSKDIFAKGTSERVHEPMGKTEKEHYKTMLSKIYQAEYLYQTGKITKDQRDNFIVEAEEQYDSRY
jgi:hypothetical protein